MSLNPLYTNTNHHQTELQRTQGSVSPLDPSMPLFSFNVPAFLSPLPTPSILHEQPQETTLLSAAETQFYEAVARATPQDFLRVHNRSFMEVVSSNEMLQRKCTILEERTVKAEDMLRKMESVLVITILQMNTHSF